MKKVVSLITLLLFSFPSFASQNAVVLPMTSPYAGLTMLNNINSAFNTFQTNFSGASAPSSPATYQLWLDTTNNVLKFYNGTVWLPIGKYSSSQWQPISNGVPNYAPASTGSSNAYVVTYAPAPTAYVQGQTYSFITNFSNTGAATVNVNGLGALNLEKLGGIALASGDIASGSVVECVYDGVDCEITSQLASSATGTVTSVATNNGITGGTITASGTIGLATQSNNTVLSNVSGSTAAPTGNSITSLLDTFSSTQGVILYRGASAWVALSPGTNGQVLTSGGSAANPNWGSALGAVISVQSFATSGTYTPTAGTAYTIVEMVGGGGGGAGVSTSYAGSGGGGAGGYAKVLLTAAQVGASQAVTIGAKGSGGSAGANAGNSGGTTSIGSLISCTGGSGASYFPSQHAAGGSGGTATVSTGTVITAVTGQSGSRGAGGFASLSFSGNGGNSIIGFGGAGGSLITNGSAGVAGGNATGYGAGGGSAVNEDGASAAGGDGSAGYVVITEYN